MPLNQLHSQTAGNFLCKHGFAGTRFSLDEQWPLQRNRGIYRHAEIVSCYVVFGSGEFHFTAPYSRDVRLTDDVVVFEMFYQVRRYLRSVRL